MKHSLPSIVLPASKALLIFDAALAGPATA
jgi:hypothetical protein